MPVEAKSIDPQLVAKQIAFLESIQRFFHSAEIMALRTNWIETGVTDTLAGIAAVITNGDGWYRFYNIVKDEHTRLPLWTSGIVDELKRQNPGLPNEWKTSAVTDQAREFITKLADRNYSLPKLYRKLAEKARVSARNDDIIINYLQSLGLRNPGDVTITQDNVEKLLSAGAPVPEYKAQDKNWLQFDEGLDHAIKDLPDQSPLKALLTTIKEAATTAKLFETSKALLGRGK